MGGLGQDAHLVANPALVFESGPWFCHPHAPARGSQRVADGNLANLVDVQWVDPKVAPPCCTLEKVPQFDAVCECEAVVAVKGSSAVAPPEALSPTEGP